ncbi:hypothetical protein Hanom_Chr00s000002g01600371 [Helianthus anomalus]
MTKNRRLVKSKITAKDDKVNNNDVDDSKKGIISSRVKKTGSKKVARAVNWRSIRTRLSPDQLLMGLDTLSKKQMLAVNNMGFGSILQLKTDSLPAKLSHFVVDKFNRKDMVIKLNAGNIEVNENVVSGLLGLKNSGIVIECQKNEKKKEEHKEQKEEQNVKKVQKNKGYKGRHGG